ncbi:LysM peptidoglycan-binding domain-containing protein [Bacillus sp. V3B]|uniref:LysM peptidoglycan-binding domain-containing protein n=1 Tax=Bacillus sp. V3B TaxID=2804915 RepID=UPI002108E87F|nr:LysM peptidoglycan-binding domain-containing protein [Bacillus sp. V3B]MCQ6275606.1 LysM peptidoglycan-binding domain-containing protein [Bacillus sp. V3B]
MQLFYTVRQGDTLYQIAKRWEIPVESIIAANNLMSPYTIYIGQQLSMPSGVDTITVKPGDTVYKVAQFFRISESIIIEANRLNPPYMIRVGQLLKVPPGVPYYVVQPGDTLFQIARRYNVMTAGQSNIDLLKTVNELPSNNIFPGMKLIIPYAPPGDRGLIAYTSNRGGAYDLWLYNPINGENIQLTNGLGESYSVAFWSPDSRRIAFVGRDGILYIVRVRLTDGSIARIDQFAGGLGVYLDWSPDSQKLAYSKQDGIFLYNIFTHQVERINERDASDVGWLPNGRELLYQAPDRSGISQLFRIGIDGTGKRQMTQNKGGRLNHVRLSHDGLFALYTTPGVSISIIYTVNLLTGSVYEVRGGPLAKNYFPVWSPDSSAIAYSATAFDDRGYFSMIKHAGRLGENDKTRSISNCFATPVTWSPDGRKIAYLSGCHNAGASREMWVIDVHHPVPIRLVEGAFITSLQWSPSSVSPLKKTYMNSVYHVQFQYPAHWKKVNDERYEGPDGFFQISAIFSEGSIHEVCNNEAFHPLMPYGSQPRIMPTQIQHQEACLIVPSEDQPSEMRGQAAMIVKYPTPIQIQGTTYNYFIMWVDQNHINEISATFSFLS